MLQKSNLLTFCHKIKIYKVFAQHGPLKIRNLHPESFCPPKPATRKVFVFLLPLDKGVFDASPGQCCIVGCKF